MSDYFGALMRSSGMAIGGRAPAIAHLRTVEPSVVQIDVERSPPTMPPRVVQPSSTPPQAVAPIPVAYPVEQRAQPATLTADTDPDEVPSVRAGFSTTPQGPPRAAAHAAADPSSASTASAAETTKPALGESLVRAAMQWVAADPQQVHSVRQVVPRAPSLPAVTDESSVITTTPAHSAAPAYGAAPADPTARESVQALRPPVRSARLNPATPPVLVAPFARDELVEISIGAIHVRVDAPAAQTVARHPVSPPAAAQRVAAAAFAPRSALSRRALRRI